MIKFLYRINKQYDRIPEPKRFLIFIAMLTPAMLAQGIAEQMELLPLFFGSWIYILIILTVRVLYIEGAFKSGKPPTTIPLSGKDE